MFMYLLTDCEDKNPLLFYSLAELHNWVKDGGITHFMVREIRVIKQ